MICVSIGERGYAACARALRGTAFAEIRLDRAGLGEAGTARLFSSARRAGKKLIATCRPGRCQGTRGRGEIRGGGVRGSGINATGSPGTGIHVAGISGTGIHSISAAERKRLLLKAIGAGAAFVDVELEAPQAYRQEIVRKARAIGCRVIISHHDYERTPDAAALRKAVARCFRCGADIAKIACRVNADCDNARLLGLLDCQRKLVVVGMGPKGRITRIAAPLLGSRFTFASATAGKETAEGQVGRAELERIIRILRISKDKQGHCQGAGRKLNKGSVNKGRGDGRK